MTQLILDTTQVQQLGSGPTLVECRDSAGKLVGFLHLAGRNEPAHVPDVTAEELAAYEREPGGRNLQDILTDLRKRRS